MAKKIFERFTTEGQKLLSSGKLSMLGDRIHDPNLWHLNRRSISRAFFVAFFTSISLMLFPCHTITATFLAVWLRANLPISLSLVWLVNPFTIPPLAFAALKIGLLVMPGEHTHNIGQLMHFDWSTGESLLDKAQSFWHLFERVWEPFMLGSVSLGLLVGGSCYLLIQGFWRWHVVRSWKNRHPS
ncbi:MAG TPA: DUF2062 domain-containing protein [Pseudomonadales bacterium]|mgnify:FL=1|jgi:hypothetical protein|nr:DUF2062 domain-containing protein [Pseudomonadales bacterium]